MDESQLKEKINSWFLEEDNLCSIRSFLKNLILQKIIEGDQETHLNLLKTFDPIDLTISFLLTDFLLHCHFHYTLSVLSSEILTTTLKDHYYDYFNKISYKWDPTKPPKLDYNVVCDILTAMCICPSGKWGMDIINKYFMNGEGSLIKIIVHMIRTYDGFCNTTKEGSSKKEDLVDKCIGPTSKDYILEKLEESIKKKERYLEKNINIQQMELSKSREVLASCNETLEMKMEEARDLLREVKELKESIIEDIETAREQACVLEELSASIAAFSSLAKEITSPDALSSRRGTDQASQAQPLLVHSSTQTDSPLISSASQTTLQYHYIQQLEEENQKLTFLTGELEGRVNVLSDKTIALNRIINSIKNVETMNQNPLSKEIDKVQKPEMGGCYCEKFDSIILAYTMCFNKVKGKLHTFNNSFIEAEENYQTYLASKGLKNKTKWS